MLDQVPAQLRVKVVCRPRYALPGWSDLAKAMRYALTHWGGLILYLDDGRLEMDTNVDPILQAQRR